MAVTFRIVFHLPRRYLNSLIKPGYGQLERRLTFRIVLKWTKIKLSLILITRDLPLTKNKSREQKNFFICKKWNF